MEVGGEASPIGSLFNASGTYVVPSHTLTLALTITIARIRQHCKGYSPARAQRFEPSELAHHNGSVHLVAGYQRHVDALERGERP